MEQITSAIIAAIVGFITSYLTRYTNITTQSRIDWIQRVREISIEFINSIENSQNGVISQVPKTKNNKVLNKLKMHLNLHKGIIKTDEKTKSSELLNKLKMYLNPCEEIDKEINALLNISIKEKVLAIYGYIIFGRNPINDLYNEVSSMINDIEILNKLTK